MFIDLTIRKRGDYAVYATVTGSYGETLHRMVGSPHIDAYMCALAALRRHMNGARNVEFVNLRTGRRVPVKELCAQQLRSMG